MFFLVNYVGECIWIVFYMDLDYVSFKIFVCLMIVKFLYIEIWEKGGVYGGGVKFSYNGIFIFYFYRDLNIIEMF